MDKKPIFVIGLDEFNLRELETVHNASEYQFHASWTTAPW